MLGTKRKHCPEAGEDSFERRQHVAKKTKILGKSHYDDLSDELVLRIFSFLPVAELIKVERVCRRFGRLAIDNAIWREKYYTEYVVPRMRRLPGLANLGAKERDEAALQHAFKLAKWQENSERHKAKADWKRRFKLKLNWSKGRCVAHEVSLDCPPQPRILVKVHLGTTITASETYLRSYSQQSGLQLQYSHRWANASRKPTALAVSAKDDATIVAIGFDDGCVEIYLLHTDHRFELQSTFYKGGELAVTGLAMTWPYLLMLSGNEIRLIEMRPDTSSSSDLFTPMTLADLQSISPVALTSLSIRKVSSALIASIAYPFHRLNAGYCLGIQEIRISLAGEVMKSRLATTVNTPLQDYPLRKRSQILSRATSTAPFPLHPQLMHPPNSLSHSGCYVIAGLPDNTLMVYTVTSTADKLEISAGRRLWGHTASISGTEVSERGKALSVSVKGDEIRVWELEDILSAYTMQSTSTALRPHSTAEVLATALAKRGNGLGLTVQEMKHELAWTRHWIGFDDEQVVVLGERDQKQILSCFTFA